MSSINQVTLVGRLGKDPELRSTSNGKSVANLSIATDGRGDTTDWHTVVCWGQDADFANRHLQKGDLVGVTGRITYRTWDDPKSGQTKHFTDIVAYSVQALTGKDRKPPEPQREPVKPQPSLPDPSLPF